MLPPRSLHGFVALCRTNMLFYTRLDPFPITWQVWDLAFVLALPEAAICLTRTRAVCCVCVLVSGCVCWCWAVCVGLCALCVAKHAWPCTWWGHGARFLCFPELRKWRQLDFFSFFSRLAWQWSGLHHGYVSIKTTHSHSNDLSPQPKGPFAAWLNPAASLTCQSQKPARSSWVLCIILFLSLTRFMMLPFNVWDLNNLAGEEKKKCHFKLKVSFVSKKDILIVLMLS